MDRVFFRRLIIGAMICVAGVFVILAMATSGYAQNIKKKNGLNFQVPEDWPIEKRGGITAPIPTEEYISIKFKAVEEEFKAVKADLTSKFEELQSDIKNMEINFTKEVQKAQLQADSQAGAKEGLTDILASLASLKSEVGRLDRKITNKVAVARAKSEEVSTLIRSFEKKIETLQSRIKDLDEDIDYIYNKQESTY